MTPQTAEILSAAWGAGNCVLVYPDRSTAINTPGVVGMSIPGQPGSFRLPDPANSNAPSPRPLAG